MTAVTKKASMDRRRRILDAARGLVLRRGLRATTMEAIAHEAEIAKPTLYSYFADKQAVVSAVIADLAADIRSGFDVALAGEGDPAERIGRALGGKYRTIARVLEYSPHADDLYAGQVRGSAAALAVEAHVEAAVVRELAAAGVPRPRQLAQLLLAAAHGVARRASAPGEVGPAIRLLAERLLRPEM